MLTGHRCALLVCFCFYKTIWSHCNFRISQTTHHHLLSGFLFICHRSCNKFAARHHNSHSNRLMCLRQGIILFIRSSQMLVRCVHDITMASTSKPSPAHCIFLLLSIVIRSATRTHITYPEHSQREHEHTLFRSTRCHPSSFFHIFVVVPCFDGNLIAIQSDEVSELYRVHTIRGEKVAQHRKIEMPSFNCLAATTCDIA